jgi:hypothetical protein
MPKTTRSSAAVSAGSSRHERPASALRRTCKGGALRSTPGIPHGPPVVLLPPDDAFGSQLYREMPWRTLPQLRNVATGSWWQLAPISLIVVCAS